MKRVEASLHIAASPDQVWAVIIDFAKWSQWNRVMPRLEGHPTEGNQVELQLALPGRRLSRQKPCLTRVITNQELRWYDQVFHPKLFASEHWITLNETHNGCRVNHGEEFSGWLSTFMGRKTLKQTKKIFDLMNRDLNQRVEDLK
tara:strand:- start:435 stop:869 length:435 start_codon:yes stop_codon:yes gene_type:complete